MTDETYETLILDHSVRFSLSELCRACAAEATEIVALVDYGVLEPIGEELESWEFSGPNLHRARVALRLQQDLEINPAGAAMVLDLLEEIEILRARLRSLGQAF